MTEEDGEWEPATGRVEFGIVAAAVAVMAALVLMARLFN